MRFSSPRFQGDQLLLDILNDPDTGTRKLKKGSPLASVTRVQQALLDLHWVEAAGLIAEELFVDGDYGPATEGTVRNYKSFYGITFPWGDPYGMVDGYTGPRTLAQLDVHCTLFDEARAAINARAEKLLDGGMPLTLAEDQSAPAVRPILGTFGASVTFHVDGVYGEIVYLQGYGAFEVHGPIYIEWIRRGYVTGHFGFPLSDVLEDDRGYLVSSFQGGTIYFNPKTGRLSGGYTNRADSAGVSSRF